MERLIVNVGNIDRGIRLVIGIAALAAVFVGPFAGGGWGRIALGAVGVIMIATSAIKFCPLYSLIGARTNSID